MATTKSAKKTEAPKASKAPKIDSKILILGGAAIAAVALLLFMKSPAAEKYGFNLDGMSSSANYSKYEDMIATDYTKGEPEFQGGPNQDCSQGCLDSRIQLLEPATEARLTTRKTHKISWTTDESIEARFYKISIHAMGCGNNCPAPYVVKSKVRGLTYNWQIASFQTVPSYLQNTPVWLRVTTENRYNSNGQAENYYNQVPVVFPTNSR